MTSIRARAQRWPHRRRPPRVAYAPYAEYGTGPIGRAARGVGGPAALGVLAFDAVPGMRECMREAERVATEALREQHAGHAAYVVRFDDTPLLERLDPRDVA